MTVASDDTVLPLCCLTREGISVLGTFQYVTSLLAAEKPPALARPRRNGNRMTPKSPWTKVQ